MKEHTREEPRITAAAERKMRAWSLAQEVADWSTQSHRIDAPHGRLGDYITISREAGAGGSEIASAVGEKLGWGVLDRNLVDCVAERFHLSRPMLELVDETRSNWVFDIFGPWFDRKVVPHEKYVIRLVRIVTAAARRGGVVIVGRGGQFLLPPGEGLAVRIIASEKYRVRRIMEKYGLAESRARNYLATVDRGRREFVARFFRHDVNDPHLYDLVINVERFGLAGAVAEILAAVGQSATTGSG
jgi:hypothetical protein